MPIYEYRAVGDNHCEFCRDKFEVRQGINDEPLRRCPECGAEVRRLFPRSFVSLKGPLTSEEAFATHTEEEADEPGLDEGFGEDEVWE
jgi:putative FmdB family regulatory protein